MLTEDSERDLARYRPLFPKGATGTSGRPRREAHYVAEAIYDRSTETAFGLNINPDLFRETSTVVF
jgi:hypothetical protein